MLVALVLTRVAARLRVRNLSFAVGRRAVFLRDGLLERRLACVRFEKIQALTLQRTPFDRRAGMARVRVDTAAAPAAGQPFVIPFLGLRDARQLVQRLGREAAAVGFRW